MILVSDHLFASLILIFKWLHTISRVSQLVANVPFLPMCLFSLCAFCAMFHRLMQPNSTLHFVCPFPIHVSLLTCIFVLVITCLQCQLSAVPVDSDNSTLTHSAQCFRVFFFFYAQKHFFLSQTNTDLIHSFCQTRKQILTQRLLCENCCSVVTDCHRWRICVFPHHHVCKGCCILLYPVHAMPCCWLNATHVV